MMTNFIRFTLLLLWTLLATGCQATVTPTASPFAPTSVPPPTNTPAPLPTATPPPAEPTARPVEPTATTAHAHAAAPTPYEYDLPSQPVMPTADSAPTMQNAAGFESQFATADHFVLLLTGLAAAPDGQAYQGWLKSSDGALLGLGQLAPAGDGSLAFEWTSPTGENLLSRYTSFEITLEPADGSDAPTGPAAYQGMMTDEQVASVRLLFVTNTAEPATPLNAPFIPGLLTEMEVAIQHIQNAQNAEAIGAAQEMRVHLEHVINILEGSAGERFQDYNGDGAAQDPGDGYGVKGYARRAASVLAADDLAVAIESGVNALQDQAVALIELEDLAQAATLLSELHTAAEALRNGDIANLYRLADKMAWFAVQPVP